MDVNYGFISNAEKFRTKFLRNYQLNLIQNGTVEPAHSVNNVINSSKKIVYVVIPAIDGITKHVLGLGNNLTH